MAGLRAFCAVPLGWLVRMTVVDLRPNGTNNPRRLQTASPARPTMHRPREESSAGAKRRERQQRGEDDVPAQVGKFLVDALQSHFMYWEGEEGCASIDTESTSMRRVVGQYAVDRNRVAGRMKNGSGRCSRRELMLHVSPKGIPRNQNKVVRKEHEAVRGEATVLW